MEKFWSYFPILVEHQYFGTVLSQIVILLLAWTALKLSRRGIALFIGLASRNVAEIEDRKRIETLARVFRYLSTVTIITVTFMLMLGEFGISIAPILGAAGVVGLAVGFGAQSLVKDFFSGFTLLLENQIRQGDVVTVAGMTGVVESVTLRTVRLRGYDGSVHFVPTGKIEIVTNMSMEFGQAAMDIGVAYREDTDSVFEVMKETARLLREDPVFGPKIIGDLDIAGVDQLADSAVMIKCRIKCLPMEQWGVRREYLRRIKQAFDHAGIEIPFPHLTLYAGQVKTGETPPLPLTLQTSALSTSGQTGPEKH